MGDELLPYYERELAFLHALGGEFARANPKIAARLGLRAEEIRDPHLQRMVQAVAYLNARIRHKLDDDFPQLTEALLGVLYPHYLAPVPALAVVQFQLQAGQTGPAALPRDTPLETDPIDGEPCRFRTCYPLTLWPLRVESARLAGQPLPAPRLPGTEAARSLLRLVLRSADPSLSLAALAPSRLRFFLRGQEPQAFALYDLLLNGPLQVAAGAVDDPEPLALGAGALQAVGFAPDEGLLPYPPRAFMGYRLLSEFFAFPQKFLFFDLLLSAAALGRGGERLEILVYSRHARPDLERSVTAQSFALGCTPVVNLFRQRAEVVPLDHARYEYEVVPDWRRRRTMEVYTVDRVTASDADGHSRTCLPFYGPHHGGESSGCFWYARRRPGRQLPGSETFLALVDLDLQPAQPAQTTLGIDTTCLNRNLQDPQLFVGRPPRFHPCQGGAALSGIDCLVAPTPTRPPPAGGWWRLLSHLSLNHLSLTGGEAGTQALREILRLYDPLDSGETRALIEAIGAVQAKPVTGRAPPGGGRGGGYGPDSLCRGTQVTLWLDEARCAARGWFLFASVLERFLALYCSINSFVRLEARSHGDDRLLRQWPPRAGDQPLL
ncbi:MAG: type VI secretion system baseplate subunit TssF [Pseudomonadota bacterium]|nr:type VI secretion system baseplate subunit TssF [Pseudomonadota bacterium]